MNSGYAITVEGQYFIKSGEGKGKSLKSYTLQINLPSMDKALSIVKNKILDKVLPKKYPDYITYRTHHIVDVKPFGDVTAARLSLWQMNRKTIESYIKENSLPVKCKLYLDLISLRQAVEMAESDVDRFLIHQAEAEEDYQLNNALAELNPGVFGNEAETQSEHKVKQDYPEDDPLANL